MNYIHLNTSSYEIYFPLVYGNSRLIVITNTLAFSRKNIWKHRLQYICTKDNHYTQQLYIAQKPFVYNPAKDLHELFPVSAVKYVHYDFQNTQIILIRWVAYKWLLLNTSKSVIPTISFLTTYISNIIFWK